jgi:hypothetical protein
MRPRIGSILLLAAATVVVAGCSAEEADDEAEGSFVAVAEEIEGSDVSRITLVESAVTRLALETVEIGPDLVIPYGALLYDEKGQAWTYTSPEPLVYVREPVEVDRIEDERVALASGPAPGTEVVTVGAAELYGVEVGVGGGH